VSNFKSIGQGVRGLRLPKIGGFPLTLNVALTTVFALTCYTVPIGLDCAVFNVPSSSV